MVLKSMTDFVLEELKYKQDKYYENDSNDNDKSLIRIGNYAKFLKQPLTLRMLIAADENGNVLTEPKLISELRYEIEDFQNKLIAYEAAKERVLFEGFEIRTEKNKQLIGIEGYEIKLPLEKLKMTIENLANDWEHIQLTELAEKQFK